MQDIIKLKQRVGISRHALSIRSLNSREKFFVYFFSFLIIASSAAIAVKFYYSNTQAAPTRGGEHIEAMIGSPRFVNSTLSQINDTDRDISRLIYSGLMRYDSEGKLVEDLAESFTIEENKNYRFKIRDNALWHDGQLLTADDVVFTIKLIQDPKYASPLRQNWQGVEVEKADEKTVVFKLPSPYGPFLENATVGILPKHIWENSSPASFSNADANLQPTGSGPYKFEKFQKDAAGNIISYTLRVNDKFYGKIPNIEAMTFKFFDTEDEALMALKNGDVSAMSFVSGFNAATLENIKGTDIHNFTLPRYFAVFFNQTKSQALSDGEVRKALAHATNRDELIKTAAAGKGEPVYGPIIKELLGYNPQMEEKYPLSQDEAKKLLDEAKWIDSDGDGIREKKIKSSDANPTPLEINLITVQWPELERAMHALKDQWEQ